MSVTRVLNRSMLLMSTVYLALILGGCSTMTSVGPLSESEQRLREQSKKYTTMTQGALIGAVLGAAVGAAVGQDAGSAAIGAAAGAALGATTGYYVAEKQKQYASEEERLTSMIADVSRENQDLTAYLTTVHKYVEESTRKIAEINGQYQNQQISRDHAKSQLTRIVENRQQIADAIASLKKKQEEYRIAAQKQKAVSGEQEVSKLAEQIKLLEQSIGNLEKDLDSLDAALEVSRVG